MDPMTAFLMSMQAAGVVTSIFGARSQQKLIKMGRKLEKAQFETNMEALKYQAADESLAELKELRKNVGALTVLDAAKGNRQGTSAWGITEGMNAYENDERKRRMNLLAKESDLRAGHIMQSLTFLQSETQLGQSLAKSVFDTIPTTSLLSKGTSGSKPRPEANESFSWGY